MSPECILMQILPILCSVQYMHVKAAERSKFLIRHFGGLCVAVRPDQQLHLTSECKDQFRLTPTKSIEHVSSGRCISVEHFSDNAELKLTVDCTTQFEQTSSFSVKLVSSGMCWHPYNGDIEPAVNTVVVIYNGCDEDRLQFKFEHEQSETDWAHPSEFSGPLFFTNELNSKRRLTGLKIASKYIASSKQCMEECLKFSSPKCLSINFAKKKDKKGHLCEFNAGINPNDVTMFVDDPGFVHYVLL